MWYVDYYDYVHRVPSRDFSVADVKRLVGSKREVDVMDTHTQKAVNMTMQQWTKYYQTLPRKKILNIISLEFSCTKMADLVQPPAVVSCYTSTLLLCNHMCISVTCFTAIMMVLIRFSMHSFTVHTLHVQGCMYISFMWLLCKMYSLWKASLLDYC